MVLQLQKPGGHNYYSKSKVRGPLICRALSRRLIEHSVPRGKIEEQPTRILLNLYNNNDNNTHTHTHTHIKKSKGHGKEIESSCPNKKP